jgi:hypothetical protein
VPILRIYVGLRIYVIPAEAGIRKRMGPGSHRDDEYGYSERTLAKCYIAVAFKRSRILTTGCNIEALVPHFFDGFRFHFLRGVRRGIVTGWRVEIYPG